MTVATRLYVAPRTSLHTVWRVVDETGAVTYQCWTACHDRNAPFEQMLGTFLQLNPNGSMSRVTLRPDDTTHVMEVMPSIKKQGV